jgi:[1-hydroxy-2-(trimethylamino)ethyl]phosphonate dioxygenase
LLISNTRITTHQPIGVRQRDKKETDMSEAILSQITNLLIEKGQKQYGLHDVTQLQHALQSAWLAEQDGADPPLIAAALLHDIGHMAHDLGENPAASGVDDRHEEIGYAFLARSFGPDVTEPVRLHVAAKRYLCAVEPEYFSNMSPDSVLSLKLQGGPMTAEEIAAFRALPQAEAAVRLRRYDEAAKIKDLQTPPPEKFMTYVAACLQPQ